MKLPNGPHALPKESGWYLGLIREKLGVMKDQHLSVWILSPSMHQLVTAQNLNPC